MDNVDRSNLVPVDNIQGEDEADTKLLVEMHHAASRYLTSFKWCRRVEKAWLGMGMGGIVAVFLFEIEPAQRNVDRTLWVVVGDLPPAYLVTDSSPDPEAALRTYIAEMRKWIDAVRKGESLDDIIPVNAAPDAVMASRLEGRLDFLEKKILAPGRG
jgi:hypothetical protein